ncbi:MAG TPA: nucleoside recognition domain-containing protein [Oligoflexia bacterium]|nr:nucleoside recognition domain-containing protein [Oligoflexia bacterium]HMP49478.1 nucleoside recognition domain-containing protein [Oligoflexia bacterium]
MKNVKSSFGPMNVLFFLFLAVGILIASGSSSVSMKEVSEQSFSAAKNAVNLALGLIGIMAFWLGMMKILESAGVIRSIAKFISPLFRRLFPDVPKNHPALGAMVLNVSANVFGLGNAATPFGIRAMEQLQRLNKNKDVATHAMCLFLAINTSGLAVLPLGVIGVRAAAGANNPAGIWIPTLLATLGSTLVAIISCILLRRYDSFGEDTVSVFKTDELSEEESKSDQIDCDNEVSKGTFLMKAVSLTVFMLFCFFLLHKICIHTDPASFIRDEFASYWLMPALILLILCYGLYRGVHLYDVAVEGAKDGFQVAVRIIPFLVIVLVSIGIFRVSGALDFIGSVLSPITMVIGLSPEVIPMALIRPLSGTGAFALMSEIIQQDPNSYSAFVASVLMGSTETTLYVVTVYFGSVGIVKYRYAILCGLMADFAGIVLSGFLSLWWYGLG